MRIIRRLMCGLLTAGMAAAIMTPAAAHAALTATTNAQTITSALTATSAAGLVTSTSWTDIGAGAGPSGTSAAGVFSGFGPLGFPTDSGSFSVLSTGDATLINRPVSTQGGAGISNTKTARGAYDPSVLRIDVNVPAGRNCLTLNLAFLSEEYPEYVGSGFNDAAIIELDQNSWSVSGGTVTAPANFAFDDLGKPLTINSANFGSGGAPTGTEYDGATVKLVAATPVTAGTHALYVSVFDVGDPVFDSADDRQPARADAARRRMRVRRPDCG